MSDDALATAAFKDRTTGLIIFGSIELLMGGCCALMTPLSLVNVIVLRQVAPGQMPTTNAGPLVFGAFYYAGLAAFFITMGVGSLRARRWARTLMLVASFIALACGVVAFPMMLFTFPAMKQQILAGAGSQGAPLATGVLIFTVVVMLFLYVLLPGAFFLFYRSPHVKATCEYRDPNVPWTERCAVPVLAASILTGLGALTFLGIALTYRALPFFGLLTGPAAAAVGLLLAAVYGCGAVELYRQRLRGFWVLVATAVVLTVSNVVTFLNLDAVALYESMGYTRDWAERMAPMLTSMRWFIVAVAPLWLGFLLWVKRYLGAPPTEA